MVLSFFKVIVKLFCPQIAIDAIFDVFNVEIIGFSVLALDSCGLGQGEGELSVKEMMLEIREKVTEQLSSLLSDR